MLPIAQPPTCEVRLRTGDGLLSGHLRISTGVASSLAQLRELRYEAQLRPGDERFVVNPGTELAPGAIIIATERLELAFYGSNTGTVIEVHREHERLQVIVETMVVPVCGDRLQSGARELGVVVAVVEDDDHWLEGAGTGQTLTVSMVTPSIGERLVTRDVGPYSVVTRRPTSGARVGPHLARALFALGCPALAREMFGVRCEADVRGHIFTNFIERKPIDDIPIAPSAFRLRAVKAFLFTLGFGLSRDSYGLRLRFAQTRDTEAWSSGEVWRGDTVDPDTLKLARGGLSCPDIFGPRGGSSAETPAELRFGHIRSPVPLVPWPVRPLVRFLLQQPEAERLLTESIRDRGATLREHLSAIDPRTVDASQDLEFADLVVNDVPVIPLALRPMDRLGDDGAWGVADINELYRALIVHVRRYETLARLGAHERLRMRQHAMIQQAYDALLANSMLDSPILTADAKHRLFDVSELLVAWLHTGERHLDYSASTDALVDNQLSPGRAKVSRRCLVGMMQPLLAGIAIEAGLASSHRDARRFLDDSRNRPLSDQWLRAILNERPILLSHFDRIVAVKVQPCDEPVVQIAQAEADRLASPSGTTLAIHFPLSARAIAEATALLDGTRRPLVTVRNCGWISAVTTSEDPLAEILRSTLRRPTDRGESLQAMLLNAQSPGERR